MHIFTLIVTQIRLNCYFLPSSLLQHNNMCRLLLTFCDFFYIHRLRSPTQKMIKMNFSCSVCVSINNVCQCKQLVRYMRWQLLTINARFFPMHFYKIVFILYIFFSFENLLYKELFAFIFCFFSFAFSILKISIIFYMRAYTRQAPIKVNLCYA